MVKNLPANAGDVRNLGLIPGLERSSGVGNGNPLQYSCWKDCKDRGIWQVIVHKVTKSRTCLNNSALKLNIALNIPALDIY